MIEPTVGRVVHYHPSDIDRSEMTVNNAGQPMAAMVAYVWSDRLVNLVVHDHAGHVHSRTSVALLQDDDPPPEGWRYCEWMTYQKGQAAKTA